jgi:hypothetical protein
MSQTEEQAFNLVDLVVEQITKNSDLNPKYIRDTLLSAAPEHCPTGILGIEELRSLALEYLQQLYFEEFSSDQKLQN